MKVFLTLIVSLVISFDVLAYKSESYYTDKMANYATIIGRATACGADPTQKLNEVGKWMDNWFDELNLSQNMRNSYLNIFMQGTEHHLLQQQSGKSPDSCSSALKAFNSL